jgi:NADH-quinone oxidoreductase subunit N
MTREDLIAVLPFLILAGDSVLILLALVVSGKRRFTTAFGFGIAGLAGAIVSVGVTWSAAPRQVTSLLTFDNFTRFTICLIVAATFFVSIMSYGYLRKREDERGEYWFLLTLATLGGGVLAASSHFASFFLGLELLSIALFALIAYRRERTRGVQAGFMYLILAGVSTAFLLFGMALCYHSLGTMSLVDVAKAASGTRDPLLLAGLGMMLVGIGFKLAVVPFHLWTPDIYDGAPAPVTGYVATVSKGAMAVLLVRFLTPSGAFSVGIFAWIFAVISGVTMFVGNILALREDNVKRILAYSSIAHLGYLLVAFVAGGSKAVTAVAFFLVAYFASTLGAFTSVTALSSPEREADKLEDFRGLASRKPWIAGCLTAQLLSLAGLPLTAGFMGKFVIFTAGESAFLWVLAALLAVNSTISLFYYLRMVSVMYVPAQTGALSGGGAVLTTEVPRPASVPFLAGLGLALLTLAIVVLGVYPSPLMRLIEILSAR